MPLYNQLAAFFDGLEAAQQESIITQVQNLGSELASGTALFLSKILETVPALFRLSAEYGGRADFFAPGHFFYQQRFA